MTTTVVKTIGTGGDYSTIQAWEDACPADLTAVDQIWQGQLLNQEFTLAGTILTVSGTTVSAANYVELTTAPGCSFIDNASVASNALRYNASNGAGIKTAAGSSVGIQISQSYTRISKIQVYNSAASAAPTFNLSGTAANCDINACIFQGACNNSLAKYVLNIAGGAGNKIRNSVVIQLSTDTSVSVSKISIGAAAYNCTFVSLGAIIAQTITTSGTQITLENCYLGGGTAPVTYTTAPIVTNCATDAATAGYITVPLSTLTFQNVTSGSQDLRLVSGSALIDAGTADATNAPTDIRGLSRPVGTSYDIGAWEFSAPGVTISGLTGASTANGLLASILVPSIIACTVGAAPADGVSSNISNSNGADIVCTTGTAVATGNTATITVTGVLTTSPLINNTGTILTYQNVVWSWFPNGRIGSLNLVTAVDGSGTTDGNGVLTVTGLTQGVGVLMIAVLVTNATDDLVYYESQVVS